MAQVGASKIGLRALSYAEAFVGVKEQPAGTNHGPNVWRKINNRAKVKGGIRSATPAAPRWGSSRHGDSSTAIW